MANTQLPPNLIADIKRLGAGNFQNWFSENDKALPTGDNLYDDIEAAIEDGTLALTDVLAAVAELEESSDKTIFLYHARGFRNLTSDQPNIMSGIRQRLGYRLTNDSTVRTTPGAGPTFSYMCIENGELKIKFSEMHHDREDDFANDRFNRIPKVVNIYMIIELRTGFTQIRFDSPGQIHTHRNDLNRPAELAYHNYYQNKITEIFPNLTFAQFDLTGVANYIATHEKERFLIRKKVNTISNGLKLTFSTSSRKFDVRDAKEHKGAIATDENNEWLTEDFSGVWLAEQSDGQLKKNLFMRVYRKDSQIRVQRGCLKKELDYGISQIREIQKSV